MSDNHNSASPTSATVPQAVPAYTPNDFIDLTVIWRRKWTLLFCVALSAGLGAAYLQVATPVFESIARVQIQQPQWTDPAGRIRDSATFLASQAEIIRSPLVLEAVIKEMNFPEGLIAGQPAMSYMLKNLFVTPIENTNVLRVAYRGEDIATSNEVVKKLISSYEAYSRQAEFATSAQGLQVVKAREEKLQKQLRELQAQHLALRQESPQIGTGREAVAFPLNNVKDLTDQISQTASRRVELESKLRVAMALNRQTGTMRNVQVGEPSEPTVAEIDAVPGTPAAAVGRVIPVGNVAPTATGLDSPDVAATADPLHVQEYLWKAKAEADRVGQIYGPRHPEMKSLTQQIGWWEKRVSASQGGQTASLSIELDGLKAKEKELNDRRAKELAEARTLNTYLFKEEQIVDEIRRVDELHRNAVNQMAEVEMTASALNAGQAPLVVRTLEQPELLAAQIWPKSIAFLAICAAVGLVGGVLLLVLFDRGQQPASAAA